MRKQHCNGTSSVFFFTALTAVPVVAILLSLHGGSGRRQVENVFMYVLCLGGGRKERGACSLSVGVAA